MSPYQGSSVATKNRCSRGSESFTSGPLESPGRSIRNSAKVSAFLLLGERKCKSNYWRMNIQQVYLWFIRQHVSRHLMGLISAMTVVVFKMM